MSDSPVSLEGLFWDSVDEAASDDLDASRVTLPVEILHNIVQLALDEYSPGMETARKMATVSKSCVAISQRALFRRITLGDVVMTADSISRQAARLRFLAARPDLAAYVLEVTVYKYVAPETEILALLAGLPNVCTLEIIEAYSGLTRGQMGALIDVFPRLRKLLLRDHRHRVDAVAPTTRTLTELEISGYIMDTKYLDCLAASPMAESLRSARIQHLGLGAPDFAQACKHIFRFQNINNLYITIEGDQQAEDEFPIPPVALPSHYQLTALTLRLIVSTDVMVPLLRTLLSAADFPALRTLALDVTFVQLALDVTFAQLSGMRRVVTWYIPPFPVDVLRAPVLAASIAGALHSLRVRFTNAQIDSDNRVQFLSLFGMESRPDIMEVVGISIM